MYKSDLWANRFLMESVFPSTKWKIRLMTSEVSSFPMDVNSPWQGSSRCLGRLSSSWTPYLQGLARVWHIVGKHDICSFDEWVNFLFFFKYTNYFYHEDSYLALQWKQILFRNQTESLYLIELTFKSQESGNMHHLYFYLHYYKQMRIEREMTICLITSHSQLFRGSFCY